MKTITKKYFTSKSNAVIFLFNDMKKVVFIYITYYWLMTIFLRTKTSPETTYLVGT